MGYVTSNMIDLYGPLTQIFVGFLLAITGCVLLLEAPWLEQVAYGLFILAGILVAVAGTTLLSS